MFFHPPTLVLMIALVAVTGWVARGLMSSWYKLKHEDGLSSSNRDIEERLKKLEAATSGLIMDVTAIREKERFMARLQASATTRENQLREMKESDISPLVTQSIPVIPRTPGAGRRTPI